MRAEPGLMETVELSELYYHFLNQKSKAEHLSLQIAYNQYGLTKVFLYTKGKCTAFLHVLNTS